MTFDGCSLAGTVQLLVGRFHRLFLRREAAVPAECVTNFCPPRGIELWCLADLVPWDRSPARRSR